MTRPSPLITYNGLGVKGEGLVTGSLKGALTAVSTVNFSKRGSENPMKTGGEACS